MHIDSIQASTPIRSVGKTVACTPYQKRGIQGSGPAKGFNTIANKQRLVPLKVVYPGGSLLEGMTVYVRESDFSDFAHFSKVLKLAQVGIDGEFVPEDKNINPEFVLIDEDRILIVDTAGLSFGAAGAAPAATPINLLPWWPGSVGGGGTGWIQQPYQPQIICSCNGGCANGNGVS